MRHLAVSFNAMAESLESTERRRLQLVGDVAHELRTPIATLDGYLEGLEDGVIQPGPQTWRVLRTETGRLSRLVSDLAELWRAEAHQLILHPETVDLAEVARSVAARFDHQATIPRSVRSTVTGPPAAVDRRTPTGSPRSSRTTCRMRSTMHPTGRRSRSRRARRPDYARVSVRTRVQVLPPTSSRPCSSASTGWTRPGAVRPAGRALASRSPEPSPRRCTEWRGPRAPAPATVRRSTSRCRRPEGPAPARRRA